MSNEGGYLVSSPSANQKTGKTLLVSRYIDISTTWDLITHSSYLIQYVSLINPNQFSFLFSYSKLQLSTGRILSKHPKYWKHKKVFPETKACYKLSGSYFFVLDFISYIPLQQLFVSVFRVLFLK